MRRTKLLYLAIAGVLAAGLTACAGGGTTPSDDDAVDFPAAGKTITIVIPYAAGGASDTQMRVAAPMLEEILGTRVVVVNKEGGDAAIAPSFVANSAPDGYTLGHISMPGGLIYIRPDADQKKEDLEPVATVAGLYDVLVVKADSPFETFDDLVDAAKADPGNVVGAIEGVSSTDNFNIIALEKAAGIDLGTGVFPEGSVQKVTAVLGDQVDFATLGKTAALAQIQTGEFRGLLALSEEPLSDLEDVPTATSLGYDVVSQTLFTIQVPAGTPQGVKEILEDAFQQVVESSEFKEAMDKLGLEASFLGMDDTVAKRDELADKRLADLAALEG